MMDRDQAHSLYSASRVGEERGYVLGVEDERKKFRAKMAEIIQNLKARGYPLAHIAEDTGYTVEEIALFSA
jgi:predicted transposase YdaD